MPGLTFTHGFDGVTDIDDLRAGGVTYVSGPSITIATSNRFSSHNQKCLQLHNTVAVGRTLDAPVERVITGVAIEYDSELVAPLIGFYDVTVGHQNRLQSFVTIDTQNGIVQVFRNNSENASNTVLLAQSAPNMVNAAVWFYLEIDITIHPTAGAVRVRLNGTTDVIGVTGINTQYTENSNTQGVLLQINPTGSSLNTSGSFDDWYIIEPIDAPAGQNDMLGSIQIFSLFPAAAGTHTDFTPLSGTNFSMVNETAFDGDTTYNSSDTIGAIDTFVLDALPSAMSPLFVNVKTIAKQDEAGNHTLQNYMKSDATELGGATIGTFQGGYHQQFDIYHKNPDGDIAWTNATVNAMEIGYKLVS